MPEVILPCPHCGYADLEGHLAIHCPCCHMRGPECASPEIAAEEWNALPRALPWTNEPPKVAGFYFLKMASGTISMVYLSEQDIKDKDWHGCIGQWVAIAGPIAPPVEA